MEPRVWAIYAIDTRARVIVAWRLLPNLNTEQEAIDAALEAGTADLPEGNWQYFALDLIVGKTKEHPYTQIRRCLDRVGIPRKEQGPYLGGMREQLLALTRT